MRPQCVCVKPAAAAGFLPDDECLVPSLFGRAPAYLADDINLLSDSGRRLHPPASDMTCDVPRKQKPHGVGRLFRCID